MLVIDALLVLATLLCSLVAGFLFAFAVVVMPGIRRLDDRGFIRAFQVIDGVIQNGQLLFALVWIGSALAVLAAAVVGLWTLTGANRVLAIVAALVYLFGVQAPTFRINIPLNNAIQKVDAAALGDAARARERNAFEGRWNRANVFRTVCAGAATLLLVVVLLRA